MLIGKQRYWFWAGLSVVIIVIAVFAYYFGFYTASQQVKIILGQDQSAVKTEKFLKQVGQSVDSAMNVQTFEEVWQIVLGQYIDRQKLTNQDLYYGALSGIVEATGDPYSMFLDPETNQEFQIEDRKSTR